MKINLNQLQYFLEVAQSENITKTAQAHLLPPSAVSSSIKKLEQELGVELFDRAHNKISLNAKGKYFASEHFNLKPDIITTAKGLGGGLPIGACIFGEKTEFTLGTGDHGSTFGGNPVVSAGAVSIVKRIDDSLLKEVAEKSEYLKDELLKIKGVKSVSGLGLMLGVETEKPAKELAQKALERGVLILTAKTKLRMLPPLNITKEQLDKALEILKEIIEE